MLTSSWPYKFVHALLEIVDKQGNLNIQTHTPVTAVSAADSNGDITVTTGRGEIKTKAVFHATVSLASMRGQKWLLIRQNRWAGHLLDQFDKLIVPGRATIAAIKAPEGFIKHTGAQHWDSVVNVRVDVLRLSQMILTMQNYHLQLPPPYNHIVVGGAKPLTVHNPSSYIGSDLEDQQFDGVPEFYAAWPALDIVDWQGGNPAEFGRKRDEGGVWSGGG